LIDDITSHRKEFEYILGLLGHPLDLFLLNFVCFFCSDSAGDFERETEWWERGGWETPYLPTSPLEVLLVTVLLVVSMIVIAYTALALYHCVCSRNYAQWRSTWNYEAQSDTTQV
jgi:hypothetical protein